MSRCCCCFELWWRRNASLLHFSVARCSFVFFSCSLSLSRLGVSMLLFLYIFPVSRRVTFIVIIVVDSTGDTRYTKPIYFTFFHVSVVNKKWTFKFPFYVHTASQQHQHSERELRWKFSNSQLLLLRLSQSKRCRWDKQMTCFLPFDKQAIRCAIYDFSAKTMRRNFVFRKEKKYDNDNNEDRTVENNVHEPASWVGREWDMRHPQSSSSDISVSVKEQEKILKSVQIFFLCELENNIFPAHLTRRLKWWRVSSNWNY